MYTSNLLKTVGLYFKQACNVSSKICPIQLKALEEKCILVDREDNVIGSASKYDCHKVVKGKGIPLHRAFSLFLMNSKNELLLQKRSSTKVTFPNCYTNTCCSHPLFDIEDEKIEEDALGIKLAAIRRLNIEFGIPKEDISPSDITYLTRILYYSEGDGNWGEHEVDYMLVMRKDVTLSPNPDEISEVQYIAKDNIDDFLKNVKDPLTPWFKLIIQHKKLHLWWDNLDTLDNCMDHESVLSL